MSDLKRRSSSGDRNLWRSGGAPTGLPRCQVCQGEAQHRCPTRSQSRPRSARRRNLDNLLSSTCNLLWTDSDDWPSMTMFCFLWKVSQGVRWFRFLSTLREYQQWARLWQSQWTKETIMGTLVWPGPSTPASTLSTQATPPATQLLGAGVWWEEAGLTMVLGLESLVVKRGRGRRRGSGGRWTPSWCGPRSRGRGWPMRTLTCTMPTSPRCLVSCPISYLDPPRCLWTPFAPKLTANSRTLNLNWIKSGVQAAPRPN